ncbi:MAG: carboxymuconolactone decarboxylase family protein [Myxococcota bacterium]
MTRMPSFASPPTPEDVFRLFPHGVSSLLAWHDAVLRGPSPLTVGQRELIAAYVSGLNACNACQRSHRDHAAAWGVDPAVFERLVADPEGTMGPAWAALLAYLRKLTFSPAQLTDDDARATLAAGWGDRALYDAILVCCLVNGTNRLAQGLGVVGASATARGPSDPHPRRYYLDTARDLGIMAR